MTSGRNFLVMLATACAPLQPSTTLKSWVEGNAAPAEPVICQREVNGEYFFVARAHDDDKLRLGSRIDLTGYRETLSWSVAWKLRNENDRSITPRIVPTQMREEALRVEEKIYFDSIEYQTINVGASSRLRVAVEIMKCPVSPCSTEGRDARRYTVEVCETAL